MRRARRPRLVTLAPEERAVAERVHAALASTSEDRARGGRRSRRGDRAVTSRRRRCASAPARAASSTCSSATPSSTRAAHGKRFTDAIFGLDRASLAAVLRGLFTADGTVADYGEQVPVRLASTARSVELLQQVQLPAARLRHQVEALPRPPRAGATTPCSPTARAVAGSTRSQPMHSLRDQPVLSRRASSARSASSGQPEGRRRSRNSIARSATYARPARGPRRDASSPLGDETVYDLTEPRDAPLRGPASSSTTAPSTCSSTTRRATSRRSTWSKFYDARTAASTSRASATPCRLWTIVLEISVLMAQFPSRAIAQKILRLPHAGPRLREPRHAADAQGIPYDSRRGPRPSAARSRHHDGESYADLAPRWRASSGRSPATRRTASRCCA